MKIISDYLAFKRYIFHGAYARPFDKIEVGIMLGLFVGARKDNLWIRNIYIHVSNKRYYIIFQVLRVNWLP